MGNVYRSDRTISTNDVRLRKKIALKGNILLKGKIFYLKENRKMLGLIEKKCFLYYKKCSILIEKNILL